VLPPLQASRLPQQVPPELLRMPGQPSQEQEPQPGPEQKVPQAAGPRQAPREQSQQWPDDPARLAGSEPASEQDACVAPFPVQRSQPADAQLRARQVPSKLWPEEQ
jgi:hypothetical protein